MFSSPSLAGRPILCPSVAPGRLDSHGRACACVAAGLSPSRLEGDALGKSGGVNSGPSLCQWALRPGFSSYHRITGVSPIEFVPGEPPSAVPRLNIVFFWVDTLKQACFRSERRASRSIRGRSERDVKGHSRTGLIILSTMQSPPPPSPPCIFQSDWRACAVQNCHVHPWTAASGGGSCLRAAAAGGDAPGSARQRAARGRASPARCVGHGRTQVVPLVKLG